MKYTKMIKGVRYNVTHESEDNTFLMGDAISICRDGEIYNHTIASWTKPECMEKLSIGLKVEIDIEYLEKEKEILNRKIQLINKLLMENKK